MSARVPEPGRASSRSANRRRTRRAPAVATVRTPGGALSVRIGTRAALAVLAPAVAALLAGVFVIGSGDYPMSPATVLTTLTGGGTAAQELVVQDLRLPRALVGLRCQVIEDPETGTPLVVLARVCWGGRGGPGGPGPPPRGVTAAAAGRGRTPRT